MAEIIKIYKQSMAVSRFIGKKYGDDDRVDGGFGARWDEWFTNGWFGEIKNQIDKTAKTVCDDGDAPIGLQRWKNGEPFEYWIGIFTPEDTTVPEGYLSRDFPKSELGVCWVYGDDVFFYEPKCGEMLMNNGFEIVNDESDACWFFERCVSPRFTEKDEKGNIILDICYYVK